MTTAWLLDVATAEDACWVVCAKGDPGAVQFTDDAANTLPGLVEALEKNNIFLVAWFTRDHALPDQESNWSNELAFAEHKRNCAALAKAKGAE